MSEFKKTSRAVVLSGLVLLVGWDTVAVAADPTYEDAAGFVASRLKKTTVGNSNFVYDWEASNVLFTPKKWTYDVDYTRISVGGGGEAKSHVVIDPSRLETKVDVELNTESMPGAYNVVLRCAVGECIEAATEGESRKEYLTSASFKLPSEDEAKRIVKALEFMIKQSGGKDPAF